MPRLLSTYTQREQYICVLGPSKIIYICKISSNPRKVSLAGTGIWKSLIACGFKKCTNKVAPGYSIPVSHGRRGMPRDAERCHGIPRGAAEKICNGKRGQVTRDGKGACSVRPSMGHWCLYTAPFPSVVSLDSFSRSTPTALVKPSYRRKTIPTLFLPFPDLDIPAVGVPYTICPACPSGYTLQHLGWLSQPPLSSTPANTSGFSFIMSTTALNFWPTKTITNSCTSIDRT